IRRARRMPVPSPLPTCTRAVHCRRSVPWRRWSASCGLPFRLAPSRPVGRCSTIQIGGFGMNVESDRRLLLRASQVLTGLDEPPIRNGAVRIQGTQIVAVDTASRLGVEAGEAVRDFPDSTLLPGLIDCHEHLSGHDRYAIGDPSVQEPDMMYAL